MVSAGRHIIAYGDESIRVSAPVPAYVMTATVLSDEVDVSALTKVKPKGAGKLHWRELTDKSRADSLSKIMGIGGVTTVVIATPLPKKKQERGRRKCLELLLPELERCGVDTLVLESRVLQMNSKDIDMLQALRAKHVVSNLELKHAYADEEPRLWIPDQILGAYGDEMCGNANEAWIRQWKQIEENINVIKAKI